MQINIFKKRFLLLISCFNNIKKNKDAIIFHYYLTFTDITDKIILLCDSVVVFVVVVAAVVVRLSISQYLPSKPSLQKHMAFIKLSVWHVPSFWHVISKHGLLTT